MNFSMIFSRGLFRISACLMALLFTPAPAQALSWNPTVLRSTPGVLVLDPNNPGTLYAGDYGVDKSVDGGATWNELNAGLYTSIITDFAISPLDPDFLYVTSANSGIWSLSPDGAILSHNIYALPSPNINTLAVDPVYGICYVGIRGAGVYKLLLSWGAMNSGLTNLEVIDLVIDPVNTTTLYAITSGGELFKSTNGAGTWAAVSTDQSVRILAVDPVNTSTLYVGTDGGGILKSYDGGDSWLAINSGLPHLVVNVLAIDPLNSTHLYAGTDSGGVFESADGGANWTAANSGLVGTVVTLLEIDPTQPEILYVGTDKGLQNNVDEIAPVITLLGDNPMTVILGDSFSDPGASVTDNVDAGLSATVTGRLETRAVGSYLLTYSATDAAGNVAAPVTRTVDVVPAPASSSGGGGGGGSLDPIFLLSTTLLGLLTLGGVRTHSTHSNPRRRQTKRLTSQSNPATGSNP